jgi:hypothetical protein
VRSSANQSLAANDNPIDRTCEVWKPRLGRDVSREDAWANRRECQRFLLHPRRVVRAEMLVLANEASEPPILAGVARHES